MVKMGLMDLITGAVGVKDLSGPVGIVDAVQETGNSAEKTVDGILNVLYFGAFIAVNLAVMNMLPIPALDGGHIFFLLVTWAIESITKKDQSQVRGLYSRRRTGAADGADGICDV